VTDAALRQAPGRNEKPWPKAKIRKGGTTPKWKNQRDLLQGERWIKNRKIIKENHTSGKKMSNGKCTKGREEKTRVKKRGKSG